MYQDSVIAFHGPGDAALLVALNKTDGSIKWKPQEKAIKSPLFGTWSTPVVISAGGEDQLLLPLPRDEVGGEGYLKAYNPSSGEELWRCRGLGNCIYATPVISESADLVVVICGFKGPMTAVRPGGRGDVTVTHRVWQTGGRSPERIGTGIIHQGRLYVPEALGIIHCFAAVTGENLWKERFGGNLWGSMLLAGDRLYVANLEGDTFVLSAGPKYEQLAKNSIPESTYAALAAADGEFFLRTHEHLYCISRSGQRSTAP